MGRPKGYVREAVVAAAQDLFWRKGWEAASLKDLEEATGVNKFGLYAEFGSKRGLYLACQEDYCRNLLLPVFEGWPQGLSAEAFLRGAADRLAERPGYGCFLLQGALEAEGRDPDLQQWLVRSYGALEARLAQRWGDPARAAAFVLALRGLMASGRLGVGRDDLHRAIDGLGPWPDQGPGPVSGGAGSG